jgi:hypothetical protein
MPQLFRRLSASAVFLVLNIMAYPALANPVEAIPPGATLTAARTLQHSPPPGVPDNYVITPNGYFDPACVKPVEDGAAILGNNSIRHADGSIETLTGYPSPHFKKDGTRHTTGHTGRVPRRFDWVKLEQRHGVAGKWFDHPIVVASQVQSSWCKGGSLQRYKCCKQILPPTLGSTAGFHNTVVALLLVITFWANPRPMPESLFWSQR